MSIFYRFSTHWISYHHTWKEKISFHILISSLYLPRFPDMGWPNLSLDDAWLPVSTEAETQAAWSTVNKLFGEMKDTEFFIEGIDDRAL